MKNRTIYLIRKRAVGDVLWIEPVIRALAKEYKKVKVFTRHQELFENYPLKNVAFIPELSFFEKALMKTERFFKLRFFTKRLDRSYEKKPLQHFLYAYQASANVPIKNDYPEIYLSEAEKNYDPKIEGPFVLLHIEALDNKKNTRKIFGIDWANVSQHLNNKGYKVIQLGIQDGGIPGTIYKLTSSLRELMALINKASFIGMDSGPAHIAVALKKPVILFFGSVNPAFRFFPEQINGSILQHYCPYAGCYHVAEKPSQLICKVVGEAGVPPCSDFSSEEVIEAINKLIVTN